MFTGADVLKIVVAVGLSRCGYPLEAVHVVAETVVRHAADQLADRIDQCDLVLLSFPVEGGKSWWVTPIWDGMEKEPTLPPLRACRAG